MRDENTTPNRNGESCEHWHEALAMLAGGDPVLSVASTDTVHAHLERCADCRQLFEELKDTVASVRELDRLTPDEEPVAVAAELASVRSSVMAEIQGRDRHTQRAPRTLALAAIAAATLFGVALVTFLLRPASDQRRLETTASTAPAPVDDRRDSERPQIAALPDAPRTATGDSASTIDRAAEAQADSTVARSEAPEPAAPAEVATTLLAQPPELPRATQLQPDLGTAGGPDTLIHLVSDDPDIVIYWLVEPTEVTDAAL